MVHFGDFPASACRRRLGETVVARRMWSSYIDLGAIIGMSSNRT